jgi:uncharacterized protein (DUF1778 family)
VQSEVVKFRLTPAQKNCLTAAATQADTTVSSMVRRAALAAAEGRILGRNVRIDTVAMRSAANELAAAIDATAGDPDTGMMRVRAAAAELHRLAARQLAAAR